MSGNLRSESCILSQRVETLETELEQRTRKAAELEQSNREMREFVYTVSHDLEEPLRTIIGFAQLLERGHSQESQAGERELLGQLLNGTERMRQRIRALLAFVRLEVDNKTRQTAPVDLNNLVANVCESLTAAIQDSHAELIIDRLPTVTGDSDRLLQVFQNLIGNGLKYRHPGRRSRVAVRAQANRTYWTILVEDNGIGFDPRHGNEIFDPFKRLHGAEIPGTGVGLAIVKRVVELHGGSIWADSQPGQGAKFVFTLPR